MDRLQKISPSTSANTRFAATPKRNFSPQLPTTPLQQINEESGDQEMKSTPRLRNPFQIHVDSLHLPACSPSVFASIQRNAKDDGTFRWSIEHLSVLYPADIDETSLPENWLDEEQEMKAQKAIDAFFSQDSIVPSPWSSSPKEGKLVRSRRRTRMNVLLKDVQTYDATTQTALSIPPNVDLKKILGQYFTFNDEEDSSSNENSREECDSSTSLSLRRKLFVTEEDCVSPSKLESKNMYSVKQWSTPTVHMRSVQSTPASDVLSSSPITPPYCSDSCNVLSSPPLSPISKTTDPPQGLQRESFVENRDGDSSFNCSRKLFTSSKMSKNMEESISTSAAEPQDLNPFPSFVSEKLDSGYTTCSMSSSSQNMTSTAHYGCVSRITPVTELMEECELSNSTSCDMSYQNDHQGAISIESKLGGEACQTLPNFKTYPWVPTCCSTPAQCSHL